MSRIARLLDFDLTKDGAGEIARRARGTPRVAVRLLRRVRDFAAVAAVGPVNSVAADSALNRLDVDKRGLDAMDRAFGLHRQKLRRRSWGVETLAAALSEQRDTIEE